MDLVDVLLLGCGVDNDLLEDILETIAFLEEDDHELPAGEEACVYPLWYVLYGITVSFW